MGKIITNKIFRDFRVKITTVFFAFFVWFYVVMDNVYQWSFLIPIRITNIREGKVLAQEIPSHAKIKFEGVGRRLMAFRILNYPEVALELDINSISRYYNFELIRRKENYLKNIKIPKGFNVKALDILSPDTVKIRLNNLETKKIPIKFFGEIVPAAGFTVVGKITVEPDSVEISGAERLLQDINNIQTEKNKFKNQKKDIHKKVRLAQLTKLVQITNEWVTLNVDIQKIGVYSIPGIPVKVINIPSNLDITVIPSTLSLTIEGGVEYISSMNEDSIQVYIDYKRRRLLDDGVTYAVYIETPKGVKRWESDPQGFRLNIQR